MSTLVPSRYNVWTEVDHTHFVFNGRSGALVSMTPESRRAVEEFVAGNTVLTEDIGELLAVLVAKSMIVAGDVDERDILRDRYETSRNGDAVSITVVTSLGCNFGCPYCFESKRPALLRPDVADAIVDLVRLRLPAPRLHVTWFGGEPLMATDQLLALGERLRDLCASTDTPFDGLIITNGWYLDGQTAKALAEVSVTTAQVTLDGPREVHDRYRPHLNPTISTYDRIVDNLAAAAEHLDVQVRVNVDKGNTATFEALVTDLAQRGLRDRVSISTAKILGDGPADASDRPSNHLTKSEYADVELAAADLLRHHGMGGYGLPEPVATPCTAVRRDELVIGPGGELWKCWEEVGDDANSRGSIFDLGHLGDVDVQDWLDESPFTDPRCRECIALPVCMGGCPQQRRRTGDRDEQCGTFRNNHHDRINRVARALLGTDLPSADAARRALGFVVHPTGTATETGAAHITAVSLSPARRLPSTRPGERSKPSAQVP